jgi:hypothetical protein
VWRIDPIEFAAAQFEFDRMPDPRIDFGFVAPRPPDAVDELLTLWQRARTVAEIRRDARVTDCCRARRS